MLKGIPDFSLFDQDFVDTRLKADLPEDEAATGKLRLRYLNKKSFSKYWSKKYIYMVIIVIKSKKKRFLFILILCLFCIVSSSQYIRSFNSNVQNPMYFLALYGEL